MIIIIVVVAVPIVNRLKNEEMNQKPRRMDSNNEMVQIKITVNRYWKRR